MPDLKIELTGNIEELAHQDYHGKRIHIKITDSDGYHIDSKIDIGVHKHFDIEQEEFWYSRELQDVLEYSQWRYFYGVISKAIEACESSGLSVEDHFAEVRKMVSLGSGAEREVEDFRMELSRKVQSVKPTKFLTV